MMSINMQHLIHIAVSLIASVGCYLLYILFGPYVAAAWAGLMFAYGREQDQQAWRYARDNAVDDLAPGDPQELPSLRSLTQVQWIASMNPLNFTSGNKKDLAIVAAALALVSILLTVVSKGA